MCSVIAQRSFDKIGIDIRSAATCNLIIVPSFGTSALPVKLYHFK